MPQYSFVCQDCKKTLTLFMHIADLEKGGIKCPECGSTRVEQKLEPFFANTSKKS
jgi:putative regulatory protein, FmdB family